jgi:protein-tyrosine-phosphatase
MTKTRHDSQPTILFVCTGNICRSPMAEYLLRARLGRGADWQTASAGLAAPVAVPASDEAVRVLGEQGIDLRPHRSRLVETEMVKAAAVVVVMTAFHAEQMEAVFGEAVHDKLFLLRSFDDGAKEKDLHDPIGAPVEVYRAVRDQIEAALPGLLTFLNALEQPPR